MQHIGERLVLVVHIVYHHTCLIAPHFVRDINFGSALTGNLYVILHKPDLSVVLKIDIIVEQVIAYILFQIRFKNYLIVLLVVIDGSFCIIINCVKFAGSGKKCFEFVGSLLVGILLLFNAFLAGAKYK